jgi:hypothetical protein
VEKNMKSAFERLTAVREAAAATERQIAIAGESRRSALLADDDHGAAKADRELAELRAGAQRVADKIALLLPVVERERQEQDWPHDLPAAESKLQTMRMRKAALERKPKLDRSAVDQHELDVLVSAIPAMHAHIELLARMKAA